MARHRRPETLPDTSPVDPRLTRRTLLHAGAVAPVLAGLTSGACAEQGRDSSFDALPATRTGRVLLGVYPKTQDAVERAAAQLDFSWLSPGDSVLLKLASNSAKPHPATTLPRAVESMVRLLKARGAGRVVVADQAGIEWVRYRAGDTYLTQRNTGTVLTENGLRAAVDASGAEAHWFDSQPFDTGYFAATPPRISHWNNGIFIPAIVREVDHIIYMPRLSAHAVTGYTMGLKLAVGWMRDDTRLEFHQKGKSLYEKYVQVSYAPEIKDKLRLTFSWVEKLLLDIGPDSGTVVTLPHGLVVASQHVADHDVVGQVVLMAHDDVNPSPLDVLAVYPEQANYWNRYLVEFWGNEALAGYEPHVPGSHWKGVAFDPAVRHAYVLDGVAPQRITVAHDGEPLPPNLVQALEGYDGGLLRVERA